MTYIDATQQNEHLLLVAIFPAVLSRLYHGSVAGFGHLSSQNIPKYSCLRATIRRFVRVLCSMNYRDATQPPNIF